MFVWCVIEIAYLWLLDLMVYGLCFDVCVFLLIVLFIVCDVVFMFDWAVYSLFVVDDGFAFFVC